ncbi:MAG: hypothetical protein JXB48_14500 [Candidatus Latescibacteria bacterium]|nr:hypothetical protein [Candidatus Latescibacterota bacterium]
MTGQCSVIIVSDTDGWLEISYSNQCI